MTELTDGSAVDAAAALGRRYVEATAAPYEGAGDAADHVRIYRTMDDESLHTVDFERYQYTPNRARGGTSLDDPESFALLVTELHEDSDSTPTRMYAVAEDRQITAVFNDHRTATTPGWRDHTATYGALVDEDWQAWRNFDGKLLSQVELGEFLEEHLHCIVRPNGAEYVKYPTAAEVLQAALQLTARRQGAFKSSTRLDNGDVAFTFEQTTQATAGAGQVEVPERFALSVSPFVGHPPVNVLARLRYRASDQGLRIGYRLMRPNQAERDAFEAIAREIAQATPEDVPLLWGRPPSAVR
ncbi:DUF2303 family protein [Pseudonocardia sp. NPDC049635]|uniref:DUF2303 family protein n=1 Tax=Pseudonocardia sp. NPDC049635 TaxID=3155506 RepID=UPI0033FE94B0